MERYQETFRVESTRLRKWDYASAGIYYVTICVRNQACHFGQVVAGRVRHSDAGRAAVAAWQGIPRRHPGIQLDEYIVMPNHVHGIIVIGDESATPRRDAPRRVSTQDSDVVSAFGPLVPGSLSSAVNHFKGDVTKWMRNRGFRRFAWQPRFHDHIVTDATSLRRIREYIRTNPQRWAVAAPLQASAP